MNPVASSPGEAWRLRGLGVAYVLVIVLLVWVSIASYRHVFADDVDVTLYVRNAGQQLNVGGDVRMNGAIVGRVSGVSRSSHGAAVELQIQRQSADRIPRDVVARVLPTTLFGQKYVELRSSSDTSAGHLVTGSVIAEDRSAEAVELTTVLDDLYPVLTAARPDRLASTLGALSGGLDGRGRDLRDTMAQAGGYLRALNHESPTLERDLRLLDRVSGQYAADAPAFLRLLRHASDTSEAITASSGAIADFVHAVTGAATSGEALLRANRAQLLESARLSRPTLELLARYSPELRCVIGGFLQVERGSAAQIRGHRFQGHFTLGQQAPGYTTADRLRLGDLGTGPHCRGLPRAVVPYPGFKLDDGVDR